jgi:hypothetical protein
MSNKTNSYTITIEDQVFRSAKVTVRAGSAAEAALIARRMAFDREIEMQYLYQLRDPAIYEIDDVARLGDLAGTKTNEGCLTDRIETLLELEGLDPAMAEEFSEYNDDYCSSEMWR